MCGIAGLYIKDRRLEPELGSLLAQMLVTLSERGPDSTGFAIYGDEVEGSKKLTLRGTTSIDFEALSAALVGVTPEPVSVRKRGTHAVVTVRAEYENMVRKCIANITPEVAIVATGRRMELYKDVGLPIEVTARFGLPEMRGTHAIGHTRMATESAVTTDGAHPYSTGTDECLVHNGSFSNHNAVRRRLMWDGLTFETENDTEVAAGYITWRQRQGMTLKSALESALRDLDGFYTLVVGNESGFGVLRDPIACKPAVMVETNGYVAFGTEYRALAELPGVEQGRVFEPEPSKVYFWEQSNRTNYLAQPAYA